MWMSLKSEPHKWFVCICSMERYDPSKNSWETVASMADKRINFGVGVMLGFIFVVGGHNGVSHLSSIERYDPHQNQWTVCRPMKEPRTGRGIWISAPQWAVLSEVSHCLSCRSCSKLGSQGLVCRASTFISALGHRLLNQFHRRRSI